MSRRRWLKGEKGMYIRVPIRGVCAGKEIYYGRLWMKSLQKFKEFRLGLSLKKAQKRLMEISLNPEAELARKEQQAVALVTFGDCVKQFLENYHSRGGTGYYRNILKAPGKFFAKKAPSEITPQAIDRYLLARKSECRKNGQRRIGDSTLGKEVTALGTVFRWLRLRGLVEQNPVYGYRKPKAASDRAIVILSAEEEAALRDHCPPWVWDVIEWAIYSGMRIGEILKMQWRDIDRSAGLVHTCSKTGKARTVPLIISQKLPAILHRHPQRTDTDFVFHERGGQALDKDVLDGKLEAAARAAGVTKKRGVMWNRFRHTFGTRLAKEGVPLFDISQYLGNSVAVCERHYAKFMPGAHERVAGVLDRNPVPTKTVAQTVAQSVSGAEKSTAEQDVTITMKMI